MKHVQCEQWKIKNGKHGAIVILILLWLGWHLALPVDFVRSDLGRHIKNGELILQGHWEVLYKNYYSYTNSGYPFINHHWLFGVFCYVLWHYFGFTGLSFIYLIIELITFYLFFRFWQRYSTFPIACAFGLLSFPLICCRSDVRPEGISYLFCGLFCCLIDSFQQKRLKPHYLIPGLCVLQIIWVNTHIFFIFGPLLTFIFWLQARSNREKQQADVLQVLFCLLLGMCLVNPSGIMGFWEPFNIDQSYFLYPTTENYSIFYLLKVRMFQSLVLYSLAAVSMLGVALFFLVRREGFKRNILIGSLTLLLSLATLKAIRMVGMFGFFWIPLSTYVYGRWIQAGTAAFRRNLEIALVVSGIIVSATVNFDLKQAPVLGIASGSNDAGEFLKREKISGVIFNNANIGSYLIFYLAPRQKVFIDNRIQPYPEDFIRNTYVKMQWDDDLWRKLEGAYHFNVIVYSPELTRWGYKFIWDRFADPSWAVVFYSEDAVIFLKRNEQNAQIIHRFGKHIRIVDSPAKIEAPP